MKLKKKLFTGLLVIGLLATAFTGCGKKDYAAKAFAVDFDA